MANFDDLKRAAERTAQTAERLSNNFARELSTVLRALERKLPPLLDEVTEGNRTAIVKAAQANRLRKDLRVVLEQAGYDELADAATSKPLDRMAARVLDGRRLAKASAELARGAALRVEGLKALQLAELLDEGDEVARALWQSTVRGVFVSKAPSDILSDLGEVLDYHEPQIRTLYDTSVSIFGRQVEALQAGDDPEARFLYTGPDDEKTRDFCAERVNKVFTREEVDAMDNGQLDNVFLTGGGYNCRHLWMEVSKFSELREAA